MDKVGILPTCIGYSTTFKLLEYEQMEYGLLMNPILHKNVEDSKTYYFKEKLGSVFLGFDAIGNSGKKMISQGI